MKTNCILLSTWWSSVVLQMYMECQQLDKVSLSNH